MFVTTATVLSATALEGEAAQPATEATHTATGAVHEVEHAAFPPFDPSHFPSQLLWLAITFGIFYLIVARLLTPRIGAILTTRENRIAGDLAEANRMKNEADAAVAKYEQELSEARAKAQAIAAQARDAEKASADAERAKLEADLLQKISVAEASIADIKAKALSEVETVAEDAAAEIVEQLTGVSVTKADAASAVKAAKG
jgi:F-type H+-transporting ATPase subunit b